MEPFKSLNKFWQHWALHATDKVFLSSTLKTFSEDELEREISRIPELERKVAKLQNKVAGMKLQHSNRPDTDTDMSQP